MAKKTPQNKSVTAGLKAIKSWEKPYSHIHSFHLEEKKSFQRECYETLTLTNQLYIVHCADIFPQAQHAQSMKLIWRPLDLILVVLLLAAMAFTVLRGLVSVHHIRIQSEAVVAILYIMARILAHAQ